MKNLVRAYQNVRFADYGTSQAAKRSLFKFQSREEDFSLFMIDDSEGGTSRAGKAREKESISNRIPPPMANESKMKSSWIQGGYDLSDVDDESAFAHECERYAEANYDDMYNSDTVQPQVESRQDTAVKTQVQWIRNDFGQGVFVGKVPQSTTGGIGGEAAIISSRLRARDGGPGEGIDLSGGFGGFVCRVCADGGCYEAFVRDAFYEKKGIEYVCEFSTLSKVPQKGNASRNKFVTLRLPFESFTPVKCRIVSGDDSKENIPTFKGKDVRYLGFRYRSSRNPISVQNKGQGRLMNSFYIALSYIKLYRIQPEPEFVYVSDARIPPVVVDSQVRHDLHQLVPTESIPSSGASGPGAFQILDDRSLQQISNDKMARIPEETYYKFRGEETLKSSGLR